MDLPDRTEDAEDAFVASHMASDDVDALVAAVTAAIAARRPRLAARLVGLLDGRVEMPEGGALARARAAARLMLHDKATAADNAWSTLEAAWAEVGRRRVARAKRRTRAALNGPRWGPLRTERDPRRRR